MSVVTSRTPIWKRRVKNEAGVSFGSLVRAEAAMLYSQVVYVDAERGVDGNPGDSWEKATKTINGAMDKIYDRDWNMAKGRHFAIVYECRTTTGRAQTEMQIIDLPSVHLIGAGAWYGHGGGTNSCFVAGSCSGYDDPYHLLIDDNGCSVEGIKFYTPSEYALGTEEYYIYSGDPTDFAVSGCQFIGANANGTMTGKYTTAILLEGAEGPYIGDNEFLYCYRAIKGMAGSSRYFHKAKINNNRMFGCDKGIYFGDAYGIENEIGWNTIMRPSPSGTAYGYTMTGGIDFGGNPSGNYVHDNRVGHATKTTAYVKGSGTNYWSLNYYDAGSGGTLYDGS